LCFSVDKKSDDSEKIEEHSKDAIWNVEGVAFWNQSKKRKHFTLRKGKDDTFCLRRDSKRVGTMSMLTFEVDRIDLTKFKPGN